MTDSHRHPLQPQQLFSDPWSILVACPYLCCRLPQPLLSNKITEEEKLHLCRDLKPQHCYGTLLLSFSWLVFDTQRLCRPSRLVDQVLAVG